LAEAHHGVRAVAGVQTVIVRVFVAAAGLLRCRRRWSTNHRAKARCGDAAYGRGFQ
jgi:hypothetical protein